MDEISEIVIGFSQGRNPNPHEHEALELLRAWTDCVRSAPTWDWSRVPIDIIMSMGELKLALRHARAADIRYWTVRAALYLRYIQLHGVFSLRQSSRLRRHAKALTARQRRVTD